MTSNTAHAALDPDELSLATLAIHADDFLNGPDTTDVAPALHVSTTFRYTADLDSLVPIADEDVRKKDYLETCWLCSCFR